MFSLISSALGFSVEGTLTDRSSFRLTCSGQGGICVNSPIQLRAFSAQNQNPALRTESLNRDRGHGAWSRCCAANLALSTFAAAASASTAPGLGPAKCNRMREAALAQWSAVHNAQGSCWGLFTFDRRA